MRRLLLRKIREVEEHLEFRGRILISRHEPEIGSLHVIFTFADNRSLGSVRSFTSSSTSPTSNSMVIERRPRAACQQIDVRTLTADEMICFTPAATAGVQAEPGRAFWTARNELKRSLCSALFQCSPGESNRMPGPPLGLAANLKYNQQH